VSAPPLALAIVGLGRMGATHLKALRYARRVRPVAVVEPDPARRERARAAGLRAHADVDGLLAAGGVEAALVAAPTPQHVEVAGALLEAGLPVLCEKPVGLGPGDAAAAGRIAERTGGLLMVGYWRRFVPALRQLRERIVAGELGEVTLIMCWQWDAQPPPDTFRAASGGIAVDMAVHEIDQIRWLTGQNVSGWHGVPAEVPSAPAVDGDPDSLTALGRLSGGGVAAVSLGRRFPHGDCCWAEVFGTRGHAREAFVWGDDAARAFHSALAAQADAFAESVRTGRLLGASAGDAVAALEGARELRSRAAQPA
jgi:myo-inositol 2-dehydrogenase/D-chiro-inositol 1-dehydrogenase